ncbi:uncharacterized protein LOC142765550 isoform X1 [Rhipicephalus microplus]|uniref:uncharacterized protein LOC142765550 isoform X1 n=1 Tax=Rhipicephalus microplus TaxID=6941 RepID=UPI003F6BA83E
MPGQYVVVLFPEEDDTSGIILKSWLKGDGCLWPRQTKYVHSLLKAKATPGADWIEVPCTVVREFDTYAEARANLPRVENGSNLDGEAELGKGRRKKNKRSYESEDDEGAPSPPASMIRRRKHKRPRNLENRPLPTQPRSLEHEGYADKAGRQPLQQHRTTGQEGALLTRSNISEVPAFDSSSPAGIRPSQRAPSPRMASPEGQNVYRGSYSNNCRPLDNLEGPPFQQHYSSQQGASWTAPNNCHEPGLGFPSTSSMPAQRAGYNEGQNVIRNSPTSRHTPSNSPSTRSIPFEHADNLERQVLQQHNSSQQGPSWTAHNNTHGSSLGFPSSNRSSPPEYVRQLMRISQTILMRLEQLGRQVDAMQQHLFNTTVRLQDETNDDVVLTPVKDIDQFLSLEGRLAADGNIKLKLIQQLAGLGGSTFGAAARRMLELLLSLEVAVQFSWAGQKGKRKFVDLGVTDVICKAVRRNFPETKKNDIECVIKVWLRHAGEKLQKQRLRTSRTHHEGEFYYLCC